MSSLKRKTSQTSPICVWDFTIPYENVSKEVLDKFLQDHCKTWCYQAERPNDYHHWQGRCSFKMKTRTPWNMGLTTTAHWSPTSNENRDNNFYVMKTDGRTEGPYTDADVKIFVPRHMRGEIKLREWQQMVVNDADEDAFDTRCINIIYDPVGNHGKTFIKTYIGVKRIGKSIPYVETYKEMMRMVMDMPKQRLYILDLPRALPKQKMKEFYAGIETIKDGYAYDDRYKFHDEYFDPPNIWVFSNVMPELNMMSIDRWKIWEFDKQNPEKLVQIKGKEHKDVVKEKKQTEEKQWVDLTNEFTNPSASEHIDNQETQVQEYSIADHYTHSPSESGEFQQRESSHSLDDYSEGTPSSCY